jgi:uncharacterized membrane protein YfhO
MMPSPSPTTENSVPLSIPVVGALFILFPGLYLLFYIYSFISFLSSGRGFQGVFHAPFSAWAWCSELLLDVLSVFAAIALIRLRAWGRVALESLLWTRIIVVLINLVYLLFKTPNLTSSLYSLIWMILPIGYYLTLIALIRQEVVRRALLFTRRSL